MAFCLSLQQDSKFGFENVLHMQNITVDSVLENLKHRYENGVYYTRIGEMVCISVNPNRSKMKIYGPNFIELYHKNNVASHHDLPAHIYSIANESYQQIFHHKNDCSIIITGESGSGKTEASKLILIYLRHVVNINDNIGCNVGDALIKCNCILESFGNAQTISNHNSSRFGKYTQISFVSNGNFNHLPNSSIEYSYGKITNYLLEKCRVIKQHDGERNYHSFYQLLSILKDNKYGFAFANKMDFNENSYEYLNKNSKINTQDYKNFEQVFDSMREIRFAFEEIEIIYQILASILMLGNVRFEDQMEECLNNFESFICPDSRKYLENFCQMMSLGYNDAVKTLCSRMIVTPVDSVCKPYNYCQAISGRDSMAKYIYEKLFDYILKRINESLNPNPEYYSTKLVNTLGILDIYGFEVFNQNGFEQFLINYSNEKLQQMFIDLILRKQQRIYEMEDINWNLIHFQDNIDVCKLIEHGMFALLDQTCISGQDITDQDLLKMFNQTFNNNEHFISKNKCPALKELNPSLDFIVKHFAGDVRYSIDGFIEKNCDQLCYDYCQLIQTSQNELIKQILQQNTQIQRNKRPVTIGFQFRKSMNLLMEKLNNEKQFYVRCIKPSNQLNSNIACFDSEKVAHQIKYLGLVSTAQICSAGFWCQYPYATFINRFKMILDKSSQQQQLCISDGDRSHFQSICQAILQSLNTGDSDQESSKFAFGKTMLFLRDPKMVTTLENERFRYFLNLIQKLQNVCRIKLARKRFMQLKLSKTLFGLMFHVKKFKQIKPFFDEYSQSGNLDFRLIESESIFPDEIYETISQIVNYITEWLIWMRFPYRFWNGQSLKKEAYEIFNQNKLEWGNERQEWLANYLVECFETEQYCSFINLFKKFQQPVIFSSYIFILKNDSGQMNDICGMALTESIIYVIDIDHMSYKPLVHLKQISSVSLTRGSDQLIVLHRQQADDVVFALCCLKPTSLSISSARMAFQNHFNQSNNSDARLGEFVVLLKRHFEILTGLKLMINFNENIQINLLNDEQTIQNYKIQVIQQKNDKELDHYSSWCPTSRFLKKNLFTIRNVYRLYWTCLSKYEKTVTKRQRKSQPRRQPRKLTRRLQFKKISQFEIHFIYSLYN